MKIQLPKLLLSKIVGASLLWKGSAVATSILAGIFANSLFIHPAQAGTITVENPFRPADSIRRPSSSNVGLNRAVFCRYIPVNQSILGPDSFLTLIEVQGNSTFRYERTEAALIAGLPPGDTSRSLTFYNTSAEQARRRLANRPNDYANLLGLAPASRAVRAGFGNIDRQFSCQPYEDAIAAIQQPGLTNGRQYSSIAALPDGNYRVTTAPNALDSGNPGLDALDVDSDSFNSAALFTFRKLGNTVTGNFAYLGSGPAACVTGTIEGNTVMGQAFTGDRGTVVIGQTYLGQRLALRLGDAQIGNRYNDAILDLNGFTRINAGSTTPPAVCS